MEALSSTGDDILEAVFGRDMAVNLAIRRERNADASQEAMGWL